MKPIKYLILGGGPSGLTLALSLIYRGVPRNHVMLLEKETEVGGLCRSLMVDGAPLDIGGGHVLDTTRSGAINFLFQFMPEHEWLSFSRISKIRLRGQEIDYPLEANLWQFAKADQVDYLDSIAHAGGTTGMPMPESFTDWISWKLGERIAEEYMLPYNRKIWSTNLDTLGTYWLHKLPSVSFRDSLRSCLENRPFGILPAHGTFLYPKNYGYGQVWERMGTALHGSLMTDCPVESVDFTTRTVNNQWQADKIISTIPWTSWPNFCHMPEDIVSAISLLRSSSVDIDYYPDTMDNPSHWIYEPDESVAYHRLLLRPNFCLGSRGYWTETNSVRSSSRHGWRHRNEFAYPLNTHDKPKAIEKVLQWASDHNIIGMGRWGLWEYINSDVAVSEALRMADELCRSGDAP